MGNFFKIVFGSMVGFFISIIIVFFILLVIASALQSIGKPKEVKLKENSVLNLRLDHSIPDRTPNKPDNIFDFKSMFRIQPGLSDILRMIDMAASDHHIKGIYLHLSDVPTSYANIFEIREALKKFKESGKFVIAYGDVMSQKAYYLASVADEIYLNPQGSIDLKGIYVQIAFFKGLLDKLDIQAQVIRHGKYKSAVEPFIMDRMSKANREQTKKFTESIWETVSQGIASGRNLPLSNVNKAADLLSLQNPDSALSLGFIEGKLTYDRFLEILRNKLGVEKLLKDNYVSETSYLNISRARRKWSKDKIAIVYASGNIIKSDRDIENSITDGEYAELFRSLRRDNSIKGVVIRINSPGGDALASDIILREIELLKEVKPVVVSMGGVAASGGYYISCKANYIYADPVSITGSIGVFGIIPNAEKLFNEKLGIRFDEVKSNSNADYISINKGMSSFQKEKLHQQIENIYATFTRNVSEGRGMAIADVDSIGQGRVWAGKDALGIRLIDEFGGIEAAVNKAAQLANLSTFRYVEYPKEKELFEQILSDLSGQSNIQLGATLEKIDKNIGYLQKLLEHKGVQATLPYSIEIE